MNSIQIQKKYQQLNYNKQVAQIKNNLELRDHLNSQIRVLEQYSKLKGLWVSGIPLY